MNAAERKKLVKLKSDFPYFAQNCLNIRTKKGTEQKFTLNKSQEHIHECLEAQMAANGMVRALVLKGRQQGCSTYTEGRFYHKVSQNRGRRAFILTHEHEATSNLFDMVRRYHDGNPFKPSVSSSNAKELMFDKIDSGYKVGTAGNKAVGRSQTLQYFHGSEVGFWPNGEEHLAGILQAVPHETGTEVILESTANGAGGVFYEMVKAAQRGEGLYQLIFVPWFWQSEYRLMPSMDFTKSAEEDQIAKSFGLDDDQIFWRRNKIWELRSEELFRQEYPMTVNEAFITSGRSVFNNTWLMSARDECYSPSTIADLQISTGKLLEKKDGCLKVWQLPETSKSYVIGADVAEGLEKGDFSCADVLDDEGNQVAQWHGHIAPDHFGELLFALGMFYRRAFMGIERNNHGLTTLTILKNKGYPNLYIQEDLDRISDGKQIKKIGWLTTSRTKPLVIDNLSSLIRDEDSGIACAETIQEMETYVIEANGSTNARSGYYDDRVMSYAIACEMYRRKPRSYSGSVVQLRQYKAAQAGVGY
jgi:hypothetical protein